MLRNKDKGNLYRKFSFYFRIKELSLNSHPMKIRNFINCSNKPQSHIVQSNAKGMLLELLIRDKISSIRLLKLESNNQPIWISVFNRMSSKLKIYSLKSQFLTL